MRMTNTSKKALNDELRVMAAAHDTWSLADMVSWAQTQCPTLGADVHHTEQCTKRHQKWLL